MVVQPNLFLYSKLMENKLKTLHVPHPHVGLAYNLKSCALQVFERENFRRYFNYNGWSVKGLERALLVLGNPSAFEAENLFRQLWPDRGADVDLQDPCFFYVESKIMD